MRFTSFAKTVAIWAGAVIAVSSIVSGVSSYAWRQAINPVLDAIAEERMSREATDSLIVTRLKSMSEDRLDLIDVMLTPPGRLREGKLLGIRARWSREH